MTRVLDAFMFCDEFAHLRARVAEWAPVSDVTHVLVEAPITHTLTPKPLHFEQSCDNFQRTIGKVWEPPAAVESLTAWECEHTQRNALYGALADLDPDPDDLVLLCDADEIVRVESLDSVLRLTEDGPVALGADLYVHDLQHRHPEPWTLVRAARWRHLVEIQGRLSGLRLYPGLTVFGGAGWHFSYFGGPEAVSRKLRSFSHVEYAGDVHSDPLACERRIEAGVHIDGTPLEFIPAEELPRLFPPHVLSELGTVKEPT